MRKRGEAKRWATSRREHHPPAAVIERLAQLFRRNGYVRWQNAQRLSDEGWQVYKKGHEVRMVANSRAELATIRRLLQRAGFKLGQPFTKGSQYRQPVYGKQAVARFLALVGVDHDELSTAAGRSCD